MPMNKAVSLLKSIALPLLVLLTLHLTGLLGTTATYAQKLLLQTGVLNARVEDEVTKENFSFDFTIQSLAGEPVPMDSLKGKVIFLNLWATWCGPCRAEMPDIESLYKGMQNKDIAFVMLSIDRASDEAKIKNYITSKGFTFPVYKITQPFPEGLPEALQVPSIPTTFVINKAGELVYKNVGTANYDTKKFRIFLESLSQE